MMNVSTFNTGGSSYVCIKSTTRDLNILQERDESQADTIRRNVLRIQADIFRLNRKLAFLERALNEAQS